MNSFPAKTAPKMEIDIIYTDLLFRLVSQLVNKVLKS